MARNETGPAGAGSRAGLFERLSRKAKGNKALTAMLAIVAAVLVLASCMALTGSENSPGLLIALLVLVTAGLFCTLGVIFNALDGSGGRGSGPG